MSSTLCRGTKTPVSRTVLRWMPSTQNLLEKRCCDLAEWRRLDVLENLQARMMRWGRRRSTSRRRGSRGEERESSNSRRGFGGPVRGRAKVVEVPSGLSYRQETNGRARRGRVEESLCSVHTVLTAKEDAELREEFTHSTHRCFERMTDVRKKGREQWRFLAQTWTITGP